MVQKKWNAEIVVSALKDLHKKGSKIHSNYVMKNHGPLYSAGVRYFGGWKETLEAAGLSHAVPKRNKWSKEIIIQKISELHKNKEQLNNHHIKSNHSILYTVSCQHFGSWRAAVEAAGISYDSVLRVVHRRWSREAVVKEILRRRDSGLSLSGTVVQKEDPGLYDAAALHFGPRKTWERARATAGLPRRDPKAGIIYDKQFVIDSLRKLYDEGHDINVGAFIGSPHMNLMTAGIRLFGSHDKAILAAGFDLDKIRKHRRWTKAKVLREIRKLEKAGVRLNWWTIGQTHSALCATAVRLYGTWGQAVEAAGINYRKHLRQWSSKTFLRQLDQGEYEKTISSRVTRKRKPRKN